MFDDGSSRRERAVSEVLAFILVFTIIIGSVVLVSAVGMQALTSYQEGEQLRNAERAFDALSDNFNDVLRYDGIEDRSGEINLRDGSITTNYEGATIEIYDGDPNGDPLESVTTSGFVYESGSGSDSIAYEGGAIFRGDETGSVVLEQPMIRCSDDRDTATISILEIEPDARTFQSSEVSQVSISQNESERYRDDVSGNVTVEITGSNYLNGWERALENGGFYITEEHENGVVEATCDVEAVTITVVTTEIDY